MILEAVSNEIGNMNIDNKILNYLYKRNPKSKAYIIEVKLNSYQDLFNNLDPSPLRKRDLDDDFITYLEESSIDIPMKNNIELHIFIPEEIQEPEKEERIKTGLKAYYNYKILTISREIKKFYKDTIAFIAFGICCLFLSFYLNAQIEYSVIFEIVVEGFNIGGWVFFWEALSILFFEVRKLKTEIKRFQRIINTKIQFPSIKDNH